MAGVGRRRIFGVSIIELLLALAALAVLASIAVPLHSNYQERARRMQARSDIVAIEQAIARFEVSNNGRLPDTLDEVGGAPLDPWGRPYQYLNLTNPANLNDARRDVHLRPINTDYDLYSVGADGRTAKPLNNRHSQDDLIRARNGRFVGLASEF